MMINIYWNVLNLIEIYWICMVATIATAPVSWLNSILGLVPILGKN
jgi:hypothetical protein